MLVEEALAVADTLIFSSTGKHLSTLQATIFRGAWSGQKYEQIAEACYCSDAHVKAVGAELWELLSEGLNERVTKKTFQAALERRNRPTNSVYTEALSSPQVQVTNQISTADLRSGLTAADQSLAATPPSPTAAFTQGSDPTAETDRASAPFPQPDLNRAEPELPGGHNRKKILTKMRVVEALKSAFLGYRAN
ncbi:MAG: hypothetical protein F6K19_42640, partial [Cyanothece sp. SIO1E1]|nr:hypothetical protein [Cyanothece sp. SIO1E1]